MVQIVKLTSIFNKNQIGQRLDQALANLFPDYSRSHIKKWILNHRVLINGKIWKKPKKKVLGGESVIINSEIQEKICIKKKNIPLNIVYEDDHILIVNKPRDLVVHPGVGHTDGTLLNALLHYYPPFITIPRTGIVHRLDKNTTGLMVVAKTIPVQKKLKKLLQLHEINREYEAVVSGHILTGGTINKPIMRHPKKRTHMSVHPNGKPAVTHYQIIEHFRIHTRLHIRLETGRTHQIRVHMASIAHPLVGDQIYGSKLHPLKKIKEVSETFLNIIDKFDRQALHASTLCFCHPITGIKMEWYAAIPQDMVDLIEAMRIDFEEYENRGRV